MIKSRLMLAILTFCFSVASFSGNEVGNGGSVIYDLKTGESYIFYDHFEAEIRYSLSVLWPDVGEEDEVKLALAFAERLHVLDEGFKIELAQWIKSFYSESSFSSSELPMVLDTGMIHLPKGYGLGQLIIQSKRGKKPRYLIAEKYWSTLSQGGRSIAILHEVIYRKALRINPALFSSINVRYFVALLVSNEISLFNKQEFELLLKELKLKN